MHYYPACIREETKAPAISDPVAGLPERVVEPGFEPHSAASTAQVLITTAPYLLLGKMETFVRVVKNKNK